MIDNLSEIRILSQLGECMIPKGKMKTGPHGKTNVSVDVKIKRFGFIQSAETIYFEKPSKEAPKNLVSVPATTAITKLVEQPESRVLKD